jgi:hypothetical protein
MTTPDYTELRALLERATPGPWDVWRERTDTRDEAVAELVTQVEATEPFAGAVFLLNANGKCPALTGCGPTSEANAALIVALRNQAPTLLSENEALRQRVAELEACLTECADDLGAEVEAKRGTVLARNTERDLAPVRRARSLLPRKDEA